MVKWVLSVVLLVEKLAPSVAVLVERLVCQLKVEKWVLLVGKLAEKLAPSVAMLVERLVC